MKIVIKKLIGGTWTNICKIEMESDWQALSVWLNQDKINQLKKDGELVDNGNLYYVTSDKDTIEFEQNIAPLLK